MLQYEVIGIACFFLLFFTGAVYGVVKLTERENRKK